jgi:hypothetical protein
VRKVATRTQIELDTLRASAPKGGTWMLDRAVFEARMQALKLMIRDGYQPCSEARVRIAIEVDQRAVSDEAGDVGILPDRMSHLMTYRYEMTDHDRP